MYLAPADGYYYGSGTGSISNPVQVFDTTDPKAPKLAGQTTIDGSVWLFMPAVVEPNLPRLFSVGNSSVDSGSSLVTVGYFDVTAADKPLQLGTAKFGQGWSWTPASSTFKAFVKNDLEGLIALPYSGYDPSSWTSQDGVQLLEFTKDGIKAAGAATTRGYVERGVFAKGRLLSLSDQTLSVVDYSNHALPKETASLTLARNVFNALPTADAVTQVTGDWWGPARQPHGGPGHRPR